MNIRITCKGCEHTKELDAQIQKELHKIVQFLEHEREPIKIDVVVEYHVSHTHYRVSLRATSARLEGIAEREGQSVMPLINEVTHLVYQELCRLKERHVDEKKNRGPHRGT